MRRNRTWMASAGASVALVVAAGMYAQAMGAGDTDVSGRTLAALSDRIGDDMHRWDGTFEMREVAADERGFVLIGVDDPDKAEPILRKAYGEHNSRYIRVEHAD